MMTRKHTMTRTLFAAGAALFCLTALVSTGYAQQTTHPPVRLTSLQPGDILYVGQTVIIEWERKDPKNMDTTWCEQEIFISLDGGRTANLRITRELSYGVRRVEWEVPDTPSDEVIIDLRHGCAGDANFEVFNPQMDVPLRIVRNELHGEYEKVDGLTFDRTTAVPGQEVNLSWSSNVSDLSHYEVLVSYDRGAHFHSLGKTDATRFAYRVPDGFAGSLHFQIVARNQAGREFYTLLDVTQRVLVGGGGKKRR